MVPIPCGSCHHERPGKTPSGCPRRWMPEATLLRNRDQWLYGAQGLVGDGDGSRDGGSFPAGV